MADDASEISNALYRVLPGGEIEETQMDGVYPTRAAALESLRKSLEVRRQALQDELATIDAALQA